MSVGLDAARSGRGTAGWGQEVADLVVRGTVVLGSRRSRTVGVPTANVPLGEDGPPPDGVYAAWYVRPNGERLPAVVFVGRRMNFERGVRLLEAHLVGFDGNVYGEPAVVEFDEFIRPMTRSRDVSALQARLAEDISTATSLLLEQASLSSTTCGPTCAPPTEDAIIFHTRVVHSTATDLRVVVGGYGVLPPPGEYRAKALSIRRWHAVTVDISPTNGTVRRAWTTLRVRPGGCPLGRGDATGAVKVALEPRPAEH